MATRPLIIDTDCGYDDIQAVMLLAGSGRFDIRGICTVFGSSSLNEAMNRALFMNKTIGLGAAVAQGAEKPVIDTGYRPASAEENVFPFVPGSASADPRHAWDLLYDTALENGKELEILVCGPLTNIAIALIKHPDLPEHIRQITILGGAATKGNVSPYAEFNAACDPYALKIVLEAGLGKIVMTDLDACRSCPMTAEEWEKVLGAAPASAWGEIYPVIDAKRKRERNRAEQEGTENLSLVFGGAIAAFAHAFPEQTERQHCFMLCETQSSCCCGRTIFDLEGRFTNDPNVWLVRNIGRGNYVKEYLHSLESFGGGKNNV